MCTQGKGKGKKKDAEQTSPQEYVPPPPPMPGDDFAMVGAGQTASASPQGQLGPVSPGGSVSPRSSCSLRPSVASAALWCGHYDCSLCARSSSQTTSSGSQRQSCRRRLPRCSQQTTLQRPRTWHAST